MMPVQIGARGQPGFDEPIALMMDCHRRIESFLAMLEQLAEHSGEGALSGEGAEAMRRALAYFRTAAPKHTADEEDSLFPALRALDRADLAPLLEQAEALEQQHRQAEALHDRVDTIGRAWLDSGSLDDRSLAAFRRDLASLHELYREHIAFEDKTLFPRARHALDPRTLLKIGREMAARRGVAVSTLNPERTPEPSKRNPR